ncbi:hypothetical protein A9Q86_07345 [Flavobacteriales bacterium 33_180_T64]|nr:hypothetical protein A9Q86_07345 [Flavobacteriales bacterium 33_180_T64]
MKTKTIFSRLIYTLLFAIVLSVNFGCAALLDAELNGRETIPFTANGLLDLNELNNRAEATEVKLELRDFYSKHLLGTSAGFGLNSTEGESETSFCFGGEYNYRISEDNYNHASYLGAFANYHTQNADERKLNTFRVGAQYTYFDRITKNSELDLTYGIKTHYEFGDLENFGNKEDITGYGASLTIGANYNVNECFSIGIVAPLASWSQQTFEYDGGELEQENTWIGLNKDNMVMGYARWRL